MNGRAVYIIVFRRSVATSNALKGAYVEAIIAPATTSRLYRLPITKIVDQLTDKILEAVCI